MKKRNKSDYFVHKGAMKEFTLWEPTELTKYLA